MIVYQLVQDVWTIDSMGEQTDGLRLYFLLHPWIWVNIYASQIGVHITLTFRGKKQTNMKAPRMDECIALVFQIPGEVFGPTNSHLLRRLWPLGGPNTPDPHKVWLGDFGRLGRLHKRFPSGTSIVSQQKLSIPIPLDPCRVYLPTLMLICIVFSGKCK